MTRTETFRSDMQGFAEYGLRNAAWEVTVIPELGAKVISLRTGPERREWMWHQTEELRLFRNAPGEAFERSTLSGGDECLPTVAPCSLAGRSIPDHGEVWAAAWGLDEAAWCEGVLCTRIQLAVSPLAFERHIRLEDGDVVFEYTLRNLADAPQTYVWAFHPLFDIEPGDRIELPAFVRRVTVGAVAGAMQAVPGSLIDWPMPQPEVRLDAAEFPGDAYAKVFADFSGHESAQAALHRGEDRLRFVFSPREIPHLGIWITQRQWNGHTHMALEPTTAATDSAAAVEACEEHCVPPRGVRQWSFRIRYEQLIRPQMSFEETTRR